MDPDELAEAQAQQMMAEAEYREQYGQELPEDGEDPMDDPDYYEYDVDQVAAQQYNQ
jgi:hypothetical protein